MQYGVKPTSSGALRVGGDQGPQRWITGQGPGPLPEQTQILMENITLKAVELRHLGVYNDNL